jgi:hypothetical protein
MWKTQVTSYSLLRPPCAGGIGHSAVVSDSRQHTTNGRWRSHWYGTRDVSPRKIHSQLSSGYGPGSASSCLYRVYSWRCLFWAHAQAHVGTEISSMHAATHSSASIGGWCHRVSQCIMDTDTCGRVIHVFRFGLETLVSWFCWSPRIQWSPIHIAY